MPFSNLLMSSIRAALQLEKASANLRISFHHQMPMPLLSYQFQEVAELPMRLFITVHQVILHLNMWYTTTNQDQLDTMQTSHPPEDNFSEKIPRKTGPQINLHKPPSNNNHHQINQLLQVIKNEDNKIF